MKKFLSWVIFMIIFLSNYSCKKEPSSSLCQNGQCFDLELFSQNLNSRLAQTSLGYSYAVYYDTGLRKFGQGGQARRTQDGNIFDMNAIYTDVNVASCAKSITTIALLKVLAKANVSVDAKIVDYLPNWWTIGNGVDLITFRDLLRHRSGFRPQTDAVNYVQIQNEVANGIMEINYGEREYENMNFCILRILIPILDGTFDRTGQVSDAVGESLTTTQFINYVKVNICDPLLVDFSCTNDDGVLYYNFNQPNDRGFDTGSECNNSGGGTLSMSANDLCKIIFTARYTDQLLNSTQRDLMFNSGAPLGCYTDNINTVKNWGGQFHHNGWFQVSGNRGSISCWYTFHNNVVCVVTTNSFGGLTTNGYMNINDLIERAFDESWINE